MTRRKHPTALEHLAIGGLRPELIAAFRDRKRTPCDCSTCRDRADDHERRVAEHGEAA